MLRRVLLVAVALAGALGCTSASAAQTKLEVRGEVKAIAFAGDALIVARQPRRRGLRVERLMPGAAPRTLLRLPRLRDEDDQVAIAASPQGLAVSVHADGSEDYGGSQVFVGPPVGQLRAVAACASALLLPPVVVSGSRIAWSAGGCGEPASDPSAARAVSILIGSADAAAPRRRVAVAPESLPAAIVLADQGGMVGLLRPSFFSFFKSEVRRLGASQVGDLVVAESGRIVMPSGVLDNGDAVFSLREVDEGGGASESRREHCGSSLFVLAPGATRRRALSLGGCSADGEASPAASTSTRVVGDRVYSLVEQARRKGRGPAPVAVRSVRGDGAFARVHARGSYRPPLDFAVNQAGRVAWRQQRCAGRGSQIVIEDGAPPLGPTAIPSCRVKLLDHSARLRGHRITLRLSCPSGCSGQAFGHARHRTRYLRSFSFERGRHRLRLRLTRRLRRAKRLRLSLEVILGPSRSAVIRLR